MPVNELVPEMSGLTITHCQTQTNYNYKDMNHFVSLAEKEEKTWPKKPVCNFLLKDEEKARRWTGLDKVPFIYYVTTFIAQDLI